MPLPPAVEAELRRRSKCLPPVSYSTRIEGIASRSAQAEAVVASSKAQFHGLERWLEVRNYWNALLRRGGRNEAPLTEEMIRRMHAW
ncbi:MAG: hypothetical protein IPM84_12825 [Anaerolineae bacterium]|nr:hypothetical protein [Anaerolineae bacterium]